MQTFGHTKHMAENPIQLCMGEVGYKRSRSASKIDTLRAPFPRRDVRLSAAMADCRAPFISELDETLRSLLRRRASPRSWRPSLVPLPYITVWGFPPYVLYILYGQRSAYFQKWTGGGNSTLIHSDLSLQNPGKSASCHDSVNDIQYVTVYSDSHYSTLLYLILYFTVLITWPPRLPGL